MEEPTPEVKKLLIENDIATWKNNLYQAKLRYRVHEEIGAAPETLDSFKKEIARVLQAIDVLQAILAEVEAEIAAPNGKEPVQIDGR